MSDGVRPRILIVEVGFPVPFDLGYAPSQFRSTRHGYDGTSLQEVALRFPSDDACFEHVLETRFGRTFTCNHCGRTSLWHRRSGAKYVQHSCGAVISPLAGTVFHGTKLPLRLWFYAMLHFANSPEGVNGGFIERQLGVSYAAAFRMAQRIRWHLAGLEQLLPLAASGDDIEVRVEGLHHVRSGSSSPNIVTAMFATKAGRIDCEVLSACRQHIARSAIAKMVPDHGELLTTCHRTARLLSAYGARPPCAVFKPCYYMDHPDEVDAIQGFLSYFLWPFQTHYKHASRTHIWLYIKEFQFRYNRRSRSAQTYWDMISAFPELEPRLVTPNTPDAVKQD